MSCINPTEAQQLQRHVNGWKRGRLESVARDLGIENISLYGIPELRETVQARLRKVVKDGEQKES